jgi:leucyl/phenylalanyl-tRNA--protein transferase
MRPDPLPWLEPGDEFPPVEQAWGRDSEAPGLLAAGGSLDVETLQRAYAQGIFPWYSAGQPILWWSTEPRMVLETARDAPRGFRLHRSLRKTLLHFIHDPACEIRFDTAFEEVMAACAGSPRPGQNGTWITPAMRLAYADLHRAGYAHSVETWIGGALCGGLYCVALGRAVYGESMFARVSDTSKIALSALLAFCRAQGIALIDCQQNTAHLASLGAHEIPRSEFLQHLAQVRDLPEPRWQFDRLYWNELIDSAVAPS